ncbi:MAG TPA: hypothetical protein PLH45_04770, partial [Synergistales bacterium]|nr:hypothetical protein [Synergistales bacterium]
MAVKRVKKVRILSHQDILEKVLAALQSLECCEMISSDGQGVPGEEHAALPPDRARSERSSNLESSIGDCRSLLRFLEPLYEEEGGMLERLLGPKPPVTLSELASLRSSTDLSDLATKARGLERRISEKRSETTMVTNHIKLLEPLKDLDLPLWIVSRGTEKVTGVLGT